MNHSPNLQISPYFHRKPHGLWEQSPKTTTPQAVPSSYWKNFASIIPRRAQLR